MPETMPEKEIILREKNGDTRIKLNVQMWKVQKDGQRRTYATSAIEGPIAMTDDDARWMAEEYAKLFRAMDLY